MRHLRFCLGRDFTSLEVLSLREVGRIKFFQLYQSWRTLEDLLSFGRFQFYYLKGTVLARTTKL